MSPFIGTPEGFSPELLETLDCAFTAAWHDLQTWKIASSAVDLETTRTADAKAIMELAATGVRNVARLKRDALLARNNAGSTRSIAHLRAHSLRVVS